MNVKPMQALIGDAVWYVGAGEAKLYKLAGAKQVIESGGLVASRNQALNDAFIDGKHCVQVSDDLMKIERAISKQEKKEIRFDQALEALHNGLIETQARLAGAAPTPNPFYFDPQRPIRDHHFIVGDLILVAPTELRFDKKMVLKEDYDYTSQHIAEYGAVARCDFILASFKHRGNHGGAVARRTPAKEEEMIAYLKAKWGDRIKDHPKRKYEVVLNWL